MTLFDIDAAAISLVFDGANTGTLGSSGESARAYDELQFTLGEGPCLESVTQRAPVLVADLADPDDARWPAYGPAMLELQDPRGVRDAGASSPASMSARSTSSALSPAASTAVNSPAPSSPPSWPASRCSTCSTPT